MKVLSFAAVGRHGRERCMLLVAAFLVLARPASSQDLPSDLVSKIGALAAPGESLQVSFEGDAVPLRGEIERGLRARGLSLVDRGAGLTVRIACGTNLRDQVCSVEARRSGTPQIVAVTRPRDARTRAQPEPAVSLQLRPLLAQRDPMLDVAIAGDRLIVLEPGRVRLRQRTDAPAETPDAIASADLTTSRVLPRDLRGRLRTKASAFEALLPGVTCRGTVTPFVVACADEGTSWPLDIPNDGVAVGRNYFTTPEGLMFYGAAPLEPGLRSRWLVADRQGRLAFLDESRTVVATSDDADDVVRLTESCAPGVYVVTSARRSGEDRDRLRLYRVVNGVLVATSTIEAPGAITALWHAPGDRMATMIVRDPQTSGYAAFQVGLSCAR